MVNKSIKSYIKKELKLKWYHKPLAWLSVRIISDVQNILLKRDQILQELDQIQYDQNGLRVIPQDEIWERRTTAYEYRA